MLILKEGGRTEIVIKRSRFIADLMSVETQEGARELLRSLKEQWALQGITHLVHAFIVGPGANVMGCSDDGEPSGTAGRPVLEVLKGTGMTNVMLTVARYFGGIKLGTGGLVKAYTESAQSVVALAKSAELVPMVTFTLSCQYPSYERIKLILAACDAAIENEEFGTEVVLRATSKEAVFDEIARQCRDITRGQAKIEKVVSG